MLYNLIGILVYKCIHLSKFIKLYTSNRCALLAQFTSTDVIYYKRKVKTLCDQKIYKRAKTVTKTGWVKQESGGGGHSEETRSCLLFNSKVPSISASPGDPSNRP